MRAPSLWMVVAFASLAAGRTTFAADSVYMRIPGVAGPSNGTGYAGWFDVTQDNIILLPGMFGPDGKTVVSQCTATIRTQLGPAEAQIAQLIGMGVGTVRIERVTPTNPSPVYRAVLRNAVLTQESTMFDAGGAYDMLLLRFEGMDVVTFQQNPDGSLASNFQGSFNCLFVP